MTISGFEIAFFTITFLVPGYIFTSVVQGIVPRKPNVHQIEFVRWLAISAACIAPWFIGLLLSIDPAIRTRDEALQFMLANRGWVVVTWLFVVLVWPIMLALVISGGRYNWNWIQTLLGRRFAGRALTAWERKFAELHGAPGQWVLVVLTDDTWISGWLGSDSHVSRDPEERDLYIDHVMATSHDGGDGWPEIAREGGLLLPAGTIKYIRYWD